MAQVSPGRTVDFEPTVGHKQNRGASWAQTLRRLIPP
jgi:hypothetical protein